MNCLTRFIGAVQPKGIFANINAQYAIRSHVDLPSEVKVLQTESSLEDPAGLAAGMGMVHYIGTPPGYSVIFQHRPGSGIRQR